MVIPRVLSRGLSPAAQYNHFTAILEAVGPALTGLFGKTQTVIDKEGNKKQITIDDDYIRRSIVDPTAEYPEGFQPIMVKMPLNEKEVDTLVRWIKQLK